MFYWDWVEVGIQAVKVDDIPTLRAGHLSTKQMQQKVRDVPSNMPENPYVTPV